MVSQKKSKAWWVLDTLSSLADKLSLLSSSLLAVMSLGNHRSLLVNKPGCIVNKKRYVVILSVPLFYLFLFDFWFWSFDFRVWCNVDSNVFSFFTPVFENAFLRFWVRRHMGRSRWSKALWQESCTRARAVPGGKTALQKKKMSFN